MATETQETSTENSTLSPDTIYVSSAVELMAALQNATGGETILLAGGEYGELSLNGTNQTFAKFPSEVTIRSANSDNPAVISSLSLKGAENITLDGIKFDYDAVDGAVWWEKPFSIVGSNGITIKNSVFDGDLASGVSEVYDGLGTGFGLTVMSDSTNITIENNEFSNWTVAGFFHSVDNLTVKDNDVSAIRWDGFEFANIDTALIEGNYLHDFTGSTDGGAHRDMIQFWTTGTNSPSTDITIRANIFDSGEGSWTQSIFMRNEVVDQGLAGEELYYQNVLIEDNVIFNAHLHGITVGETNGLTIQNNTVLYNQDSNDAGLVSTPAISVKSASTGVTVANNIVPVLNVSLENGWTVTNNLIVQRSDPDAPNYVGDLFVNALADSQATLHDLLALPGSVIEQLNVGSMLTRFNPNSDRPVGFITAEEGDGFDLNKITLDASNLFAEGSALDLTDVTVTWDYGDGAFGSSLAGTHAYANAGTYETSALVTFADGRTVSLRKTIEVGTAVALKVGFENDADDLSDQQNVATHGGAVSFEEGRDGLAVRLNGDAISYANSAELNNNSEYTLLFDFKKDAGQEDAGGPIISFSSTFMVNLYTDGLSVYLKTTAGSQQLRAHSVGINDSEWHSVALTFSGDAGAAILYVDGAEVARLEGLEGATQTDVPANFYVGNPWGDSFTGLIDNVAFLRGAIDAEDAALGLAVIDKVIGGNISGPINGTEGNDSPNGAVIDDVLIDDTGANVIDGGAGADNLDEGSFIETLYGGKKNDTLYGGDGNDALYGEGGVDKLYGGNGNDTLSGGSSNDWLFGEEGNDILDGGDGADWLYGGDGDDTLIGGGGRDGLNGGEGNDTLIGGLGRDGMTGGAGADVFVFGSNSGDRDRIFDFNPGEDLISLQGLGFQTVAEVIDNAFDVRGDLILHLDTDGSAFSWSSSNFVRLMGIDKNDLNDGNIALFV